MMADIKAKLEKEEKEKAEKDKDADKDKTKDKDAEDAEDKEEDPEDKPLVKPTDETYEPKKKKGRKKKKNKEGSGEEDNGERSDDEDFHAGESRPSLGWVLSLKNSLRTRKLPQILSGQFIPPQLEIKSYKSNDASFDLSLHCCLYIA